MEQHGPIEPPVYAQVPDLREALDAAEQLGGKTIVPPTSTVTPPSLPHCASAETRRCE